METIFTWDTANFLWNNNPYTWDEVILVQELAKARAAGDDYMGIFRESPEKKKKFVKILCKVQGTNYEENKEVKDISIRIQDVDLVVNEVLGVNLDVEI